MAFEVVRRTPLDPVDAWERLTDWERHGDFIPFTTVTMTGVVRGIEGARLVGRTGIGPLHFDDPMEITVWDPPVYQKPGVCEIAKRGRVVIGWARLSVAPDAEGSVVEWTEEARFAGLGRLLDVPNRIAGEKIFGRVVDGLLASPRS